MSDVERVGPVQFAWTNSFR